MCVSLLLQMIALNFLKLTVIPVPLWHNTPWPKPRLVTLHECFVGDTLAAKSYFQIKFLLSNCCLREWLAWSHNKLMAIKMISSTDFLVSHHVASRCRLSLSPHPQPFAAKALLQHGALERARQSSHLHSSYHSDVNNPVMVPSTGPRTCQ